MGNPERIEFDFSDRYDWEQVPRDYEPKEGEVIVEAMSGPVRRVSIGPGLSTTTFSGPQVAERWQADRDAASEAMVAEGKAPMEHKHDYVLIAEHLAAGIVAENGPGRVEAVRVFPEDPKLQAFLELYFGVESIEEGPTDEQ